MKPSALQVLLGIILIVLVSSTTYKITDSIVFPRFKVGQCLKLKYYNRIVEVIKVKGEEYVVLTNGIKVIVSYDILLHGGTVVNCPKNIGGSSGEVWKIIK